MPRTANTSQLTADLPIDLVADFRAKAADAGGVTSVLRRLVEKFCGRKPTISSGKRGRPKKLGEKE